MRQRAQSRREREKQLRGLYLKTGMAAAAAILLLIIIVPRVISATRPAKAEEQAAQSGTFAAAQEESGTEQPDADDLFDLLMHGHRAAWIQKRKPIRPHPRQTSLKLWQNRLKT